MHSLVLLLLGIFWQPFPIIEENALVRINLFIELIRKVLLQLLIIRGRLEDQVLNIGHELGEALTEIKILFRTLGNFAHSWSIFRFFLSWWILAYLRSFDSIWRFIQGSVPVAM